MNAPAAISLENDSVALRPPAQMVATRRFCRPLEPLVGGGATVFVMAYNERATIERVIRETHAVLAKWFEEFEVLVVDDGSTDGSGPIAERLADRESHIRVIRHESNRGIGEVLRTGFLNARYENVGMICSDMQFRPRDLERLLPYLAEYDVVVARRAERQDHWFRKFVTAFDTALQRILLGIPVRDVHWIKFLKQWTYRDATLRSHDPFLDVELLYGAKKRGARMINASAPHYPRVHGTASGARLKNLVNGLLGYLKLWW